MTCTLLLRSFLLLFRLWSHVYPPATLPRHATAPSPPVAGPVAPRPARARLRPPRSWPGAAGGAPPRTLPPAPARTRPRPWPPSPAPPRPWSAPPPPRPRTSPPVAGAAGGAPPLARPAPPAAGAARPATRTPPPVHARGRRGRRSSALAVGARPRPPSFDVAGAAPSSPRARGPVRRRSTSGDFRRV
nr:vegetative cell wall protein gp1-like [Lolium perenne]